VKLDNRLWIVICTVLSIAILAGGWFVGVSPQLDAARAADLQRSTVEGQNTATRAQVAKLVAAEKDKDELHSELAALRAQVPESIGGAQFISSLQQMAASTGVSLESLTVGQPTAYVAPIPPETAAAPAASTSTESAAPSASASATPDPDAAPAVDDGITPLTDPLITPSNFVLVPIAVEVSGSNDQVLAFLHALQHGPRLVQLTNVGTTTDAGDGGGIKLTASGSIYVLKSGSAAASGTTSNG
jgi:Tfp pilus assembly protein PilO